MNEEKNTMNIEEIDENVIENENETFVSKVGAGIKKHGKKAVIGAAVLTAVLVSCAIKCKNHRKDSDVIDYDDSDDVLSEVDETN